MAACFALVPGMNPIKLLATFSVVLTCCALWGTAIGDEHSAEEVSRLELTLDDAIRLALRNNRSLLDARLSRTLDEFALDVAEDRYRPTASTGSSARAAKDGDPTANLSAEASLRVPTGGRFTLRWSKPLAGGGEDSDSYSLGFEQPLLRGFGGAVDTAPLRVAQLVEEINILSFRETIAGVVASAIRSWRALDRANRQLEIAMASLQRAEGQLEVNRALVKAGRIAERELLQSEAEIADRELALVETKFGLTSANLGLIDILDIDSATLIRPLETPAIPRSVPGVAEGIEMALRSRPDYSKALLDAEIAGIELVVAGNDRLWDLSLETNVSGARDGGRTDYAVGLRLMVPLWDRSPRQAWMQARAGVQRAERGLVELRQSIGIAVRQAVHDLDVGLRRIELARRALALARQKIEIERDKLRLGLSSSFQLSQYEDDLVRAQNAAVDALIGYENALTSLDLTLGTTLETWNIQVEQVGR